MRRRDVLRWASGAALAGAGGLAARAQIPFVLPEAAAPVAGVPLRPLVPLAVGAGLEARTVVGLRPFRERGFVVRAEPFGRRRTLVHNYGHGGAGVTMSWGSAQLAIEAGLGASEEVAWAVIGAGVMGLTTALLLLQHGRQVTIYAEDLPPYVTSNIAAAAWGPASLHRRAVISDSYVAQFRRAARLSQRAFQHFVADPAYGVSWMRHYNLLRTPPELPWEPALEGDDLYPGLGLDAQAARAFKTPHAVSYFTLMIDPDLYLRALLADVQRWGGRIVRRRFADADDVARLKERAIVNCAGLGAGALFGDAEMYPVRGQLTLLLPQAGVDYGYVAGGPDGLLYMFPRQSAIVLGGTIEHGVSDLTPDPGARARMLAGHAAIAAQLAGRGPL